jgi:hypothetical protein
MEYTNKACHQFIYYAYKCGLPHAEFCKMMQHQQPGHVKNYTYQVMWMQCKNARYLFQNEFMVHYDVFGLGNPDGPLESKRYEPESYKRGRRQREEVQCEYYTNWMDTSTFMGVLPPYTAEGQLNVSGSIIANDTGLAVNKMQYQGLSRMECRKRDKAVNDANTLVYTFTKMDHNGKKKCEAEGTHHGT